jgi:hypothetical protein
MSPAVALSTYAAGLALVFGIAFSVGKAVGPVGTVAEAPHSGTAEMPGHGDDAAGHSSP